MWRSSTIDTGTVSLLCEEMGFIASGNVSTHTRKYNVPWL